MALTTTVKINGTDYTGDDRAEAGLRIDEWELNLEGIDSVSFTLHGCGPVPTFLNQQEVRISTTESSVTTLRFVGDIDHIQQQVTQFGWEFHIRAVGLRARADHVTITAPDGTGTAYFNREPGDPLYIASQAGRTVGYMITQILQGVDLATRLNALGIGAYTTLTPPTLPSATVADLANLTVVPRRPAIFSGEGVLNQLEQELQRYHPKYVLYIQPNGTIRFLNLFTMPTRNVILPSEWDAGDPADAFTISHDTEGCYTAFEIIGVDVGAAILRVTDGTLAAAWTSGDQSAWHYTDFSKPGDAYDEGTVTALTSTSATLDSSDNTRTYATNVWSTRIGELTLINPAATGIQLMEDRRVIANTALSAGGTYTVSWDSSLPLDATGYTNYHLIGTAGTGNDVWRLYYPKEPASGNTGLSTYIGSHLLPAFPKPYSWANNDLGDATPVVSASAVVLWSSTGSPPYFVWPMTCQIVPELGAIRFTEPAVKVTTPLNFLNTTGSPTTFAQGLPADIRVVVPYNRGHLTARSPASGYSGTAYSLYGLQRVKRVHVDDWRDRANATDWTALAAEHLDTLKDEILQGSVTYHDFPTSFDALAMGYALNIRVVGPSGDLVSYSNLPVRSVRVQYDSPADLHLITFQFSNRKRPFQGDDLYTHPAFAGHAASQMTGDTVWGSGPASFIPMWTFSDMAAGMAPPGMGMMGPEMFQHRGTGIGPAPNLEPADLSQFDFGSMMAGAGMGGARGSFAAPDQAPADMGSRIAAQVPQIPDLPAAPAPVAPVAADDDARLSTRRGLNLGGG